jgi:putative membrane protein
MEYGSLYYTIIKSLHIIFMVSYFAGLFYIVRLIIYHTEANQKSVEEKNILFPQFILMEKKLWNIITVPAFIIMLITGLVMLISNSNYFLQQPWMHFKLAVVVFLVIYHWRVWLILEDTINNKFKYQSVKLRMFNEIATIILFSVIFSVILKNYFISYWYWLIICFIITGLLIMGVVKLISLKENKKN